MTRLKQLLDGMRLWLFRACDSSAGRRGHGQGKRQVQARCAACGAAKVEVTS